MNLYWYIKQHYPGRELEAVAYLRALVPLTRHPDDAERYVNSLEYNFQVDAQIARAKRGMYWQPLTKGKYDNGKDTSTSGNSDKDS